MGGAVSGFVVAPGSSPLGLSCRRNENGGGKQRYEGQAIFSQIAPRCKDECGGLTQERFVVQRSVDAESV